MSYWRIVDWSSIVHLSIKSSLIDHPVIDESIRSSMLPRGRIDDVPVVLHAHDSPPLRHGFIPTFAELLQLVGTVIGVFARRVVMVNEHRETRSASGRCPLEHLQIAVGIAKGRNRTAADAALNADRLTFLVVDQIDLR